MTATAQEALAQTAGRAPRLQPVILRVASWCVVLAGLVLSALYVKAGLETVGLAWPVTHPEGALVATVLRVRDGEPLYQNFHQFPHLIGPYPPVQPVVSGLMSRLLGLSVLETVGLARSLTLASGVLAGLLIALNARQLGAGWLASLAGAGLFLPLPFLDEWGFSVRPDLPALALSLLALWLLMARPRQPWLAAGAAALAFFTKQTALALPIGVLAWLVLTRQWRGVLMFGGAWAGLLAGGIGLLELATGRTYLLNTLLAHFHTPKNSLAFASRDILPLFNDAWPALTLAACGAVLTLLTRDRRALLPLLYLAVSLTLTLVTLSNTGSDVNYLIEPAAAASIPAAFALGWLWRTGNTRSLPPTPSAARGSEGWGEGATLWLRPTCAVLVALAILVWGSAIWEFWQLDGGVNPARLPLEEIAGAERVFSDEPLAILLAGRPLLVSDTFHLSQLSTSSFFDPLELERRIKRSEFDLIVMRSDIRAARSWKRQPLLTESVRLAIKDTYVQAGRVGIYWLYEPEGRGRGR
jgi:hypothetical protein